MMHGSDTQAGRDDNELVVTSIQSTENDHNHAKPLIVKVQCSPL